MRIEKIKNRTILFTDCTPSEWVVKLHLIMGKQLIARLYDYISQTVQGAD